MRRSAGFALLAAVPVLALAGCGGNGQSSLTPHSPAALTVDVVGRQWFWVVRYAGTTAVTANELHIPARQTVRIRVHTDDVIHSFWVPELNRKIDMIPRKDNAIYIRADRTGVYRGQC